MKAERRRRTTPPLDDDAILDAAVEPARPEQQATSTADDGASTPNGLVARVESTSIATPASTDSVPAQDTVWIDGKEATAVGSANVTTIINTIPSPPSPAARPSWRRTLNRRLSAIELDERVGRLVLAVILAVLLWFYVVNLENPAQTTSFRDLPVDVRGTASNLRVISPLPTVDVTIQAPQNLMSNLSPADVHPYIDLTAMSEGVHQVDIDIETNGMPADNLTVNVDPGQIQVQLQLQVTRIFSVAVEVEGTPPLGYKFDPPQVTPGSVTVTGSQDAVERISRVVVPVNIERQTTRVQGSRTPRAVDTEGRDVANVTFDPANVQVLVPIEPYVRSKSVGVLPSTVGQPAPGYRVSLLTADPNNVQVCCSEEVLGPIDTLNVVPVPITGTTSTIVTATQLILPPGVDLLPGQSRDITVTVQVEQLASSIELSIAPIVQGAPPDYTFFVSPDRVDVTLQGSFNRLQQIAAADLRLVANVTGLGVGSHEVPLQTIVPDGVTLQRISTEMVTVTLVAPTPVPPTSTVQPTASATSEPTETVPVVAPAATSTPATNAPATQSAPTATRTPASTATATPQPATPTPTPTVTLPLAGEDLLLPAPSPTNTTALPSAE